MVCLAWAAKDAQVEEKHCYHCSSLEHFLHDCLLVRASRVNMQLNCKEGMALKKGAQTPQVKATMPKNPRRRFPRHNMTQADSLLESRPLSALHRFENVAKLKINGESKSLIGDGTNYRPHRYKNHLCGSRKCLYLTRRLCYCVGSSGQSPGL